MEVFVNPSGSFGYIEGASALVKTGTGTTEAPGGNPTASLERNRGGSSDVAYWGVDNMFPQQVVADMESNTSLATMLNWKAKAWYGGGLIYGTVDFNEQGEEVFKRVRLPEIEAFIKRSNLHRYAMEALLDISVFNMAFPELILTRNRQQIYSVSTVDACYCRYNRAHKVGEIMKKIFVNANWAFGGRFDDDYTTTVPVLDPYYDAVEGLRARTDGFKFIYPISFPSPDKSEYQLASWNTVRRSGWLDIGKAVVEFKKQLLKQILSVEWVIEVNPAYWAWKYKDWDEKDEDERRRLITNELSIATVMTVEAPTRPAAQAASTVRPDRRVSDLIPRATNPA